MFKNIYSLNFLLENLTNFIMLERRSSNSALFIGTLSIIGVMVFSPQLVFAQETVDAPSILPDSPF